MQIQKLKFSENTELFYSGGKPQISILFEVIRPRNAPKRPPALFFAATVGLPMLLLLIRHYMLKRPGNGGDVRKPSCALRSFPSAAEGSSFGYNTSVLQHSWTPPSHYNDVVIPQW
ncbi:hypothetical protein DFH09DRAFT_1089809 [Mycena vulgaris]|nr:hypothetical protein DFH09DRAFT_1089809 [Mycena vulgaris]